MKFEDEIVFLWKLSCLNMNFFDKVRRLVGMNSAEDISNDDNSIFQQGKTLNSDWPSLQVQ